VSVNWHRNRRRCAVDVGCGTGKHPAGLLRWIPRPSSVQARAKEDRAVASYEKLGAVEPNEIKIMQHVPLVFGSIAVFALGFGTGRWTDGIPDSEPELQVQTAPDAERGTPLADASSAPWKDLVREIADLREQIRLNSGTSTRESPSRDTEMLARMAESIERLVAQSTTVAGPQPGGLSQGALQRIGATGKPSFAELESLDDFSVKSLNRLRSDWEAAHKFWTVPQVVERYGAPDGSINENGTMLLQYLRVQPNGSKVKINFSFESGYVSIVTVRREE